VIGLSPGRGRYAKTVYPILAVESARTVFTYITEKQLELKQDVSND
jgi:hypothetical protein